MARRFLGDDIYVKPEALWHAYVIRCYYKMPYNLNVMLDPEQMAIIKRYLSTVMDNEFAKMPVLSIMRELKRDAIYCHAKKEFKSIFVKKRPKFQMGQPTIDELPAHAFNLEAIKQLGLDKMDLEEKRSRIAMENIEVNGDELDGVMIDVVRLVPTGETTASGRPRLKEEAVKVNAGQLTIDNFRDMTGRRFRMTSAQRERFGSDRDAAFQDWLQTKIQEVGSND